MVDIDQARQEIEQWIQNFVEVPHPALGDFPPCPYAQRSRIKQTFEILVGIDPIADLRALAGRGLLGKEVVIFVYDPIEHPHRQFAAALDYANRNHLLKKDLLVLEDHPGDPEIVNGICMNQGTYALAMAQSLTDLNAKARLVAQHGFYDAWPEDYLQELFKHREDPRE